MKRHDNDGDRLPPAFYCYLCNGHCKNLKTFRQHFLKAALKIIAQINSSIALACWISLTIQLDMSNGAFWYLKGETRRLRVRVSSGTC